MAEVTLSQTQSEGENAVFRRVASLSPTQLILFCMAVTLAVRLVFLMFVQRIDWDGYFYLIYAQHIRAGDWLAPSPYWTPYPLGYSLTVAFASLLGLDWGPTGMLVSFAAGVLVVLPVFGLTDLLAGRLAAVIAALLVALNPWLVQMSLSVLSESLFILVLLLLVWLWVLDLRDQRIRGRLFIQFALSLALVMVRPIGIAVLLGGLAVTFLRQTYRRQRLIESAAVVAIVIPLYAAYAQGVSARLQEITGRSQPSYLPQEISRGLAQFYQTDPAQMARLTLYEPAMSAIQFLASNLMLILRRYVYLILDHISRGIAWGENGQAGTVVPVYLVLLTGIGIWVCRGERWRFAPLVGMILYPLTTPLFVEDPRYSIPLLPIILIYVGSALASIWGINRRVGSVLLGGILIIGGLETYQFNFHVWPVPSNQYQEIGVWLRNHEKPAIVVSNHPAPAFYSGAELQLFAGNDLASFLSESASIEDRRIDIVTELEITQLLKDNATYGSSVLSNLTQVYPALRSDTLPFFVYRVRN